MAADVDRYDWHLTPNGWIEGSEEHDFGKKIDRPIPPDRVLTVCIRHVMPSGHRPHHRTEVREKWRHDDKSLVESLLAKYGEKK